MNFEPFAARFYPVDLSLGYPSNVVNYSQLREKCEIIKEHLKGISHDGLTRNVKARTIDAGQCP